MWISLEANLCTPGGVWSFEDMVGFDGVTKYRKLNYNINKNLRVPIIEAKKKIR